MQISKIQSAMYVRNNTFTAKENDTKYRNATVVTGAIALVALTASVIFAVKNKTLNGNLDKVKNECSTLEQNVADTKVMQDSVNKLQNKINFLDQKAKNLSDRAEQAINLVDEAIAQQEVDKLKHVLDTKDMLAQQKKNIEIEQAWSECKYQSKPQNYETSKTELNAISQEISKAWKTHEQELISSSIANDIQTDKEIAEWELKLAETMNKKKTKQLSEKDEQIEKLKQKATTNLIERQEIEEDLESEISMLEQENLNLKQEVANLKQKIFQDKKEYETTIAQQEVDKLKHVLDTKDMLAQQKKNIEIEQAWSECKYQSKPQNYETSKTELNAISQEISKAWKTHEQELISSSIANDIQTDKEIAEWELKLSKQQVKKYHKQLSKKEQENTGLRENLSAQKGKIDELEKKVNDTVLEYEERLAEQNQQFDQLNTELVAKEKEVQNLREQITENALKQQEQKLFGVVKSEEQSVQSEHSQISQEIIEEPQKNILQPEQEINEIILVQEEQQSEPVMQFEQNKARAVGLRNVFRNIFVGKIGKAETKPAVVQRLEQIKREYNMSYIDDDKKEALNSINILKLDAMSDLQIRLFLQEENGKDMPLRAAQKIDEQFSANEIKKISDSGYDGTLIEWAYNKSAVEHHTNIQRERLDWLKFIANGA